MDQTTLLALGFEINCGAIDRNGKSYGRLTQHGVEWNDAGRELMNELVVDEAPAAVQAAPARKQAKVQKAKPGLPAPAAPAEEVPSIDDLLGDSAE